MTKYICCAFVSLYNKLYKTHGTHIKIKKNYSPTQVCISSIVISSLIFEKKSVLIPVMTIQLFLKILTLKLEALGPSETSVPVCQSKHRGLHIKLRVYPTDFMFLC